MIPGLLGAFGAAVLYGAGTILQAVGVRRLTDATAQGWARWWAGRLYAVGLLADTLGFLASIAALRTLPLFLVQSAIASSVAVTAALAVLFLGVRLGRQEVLALVAVGVGIAALAFSAREGRAVALTGPAPWLLLGSVLVLAALGLVSLRKAGPDGAVLLAVTAGLGFGGVGVCARVLVVPSAAWRVVLDPVSWALVAFAGIALAGYALALQRGSVTTTAAVTFTAETVLPAALGLVWLGDRIRPGAAPIAAAGFVVTLAGCIALARHSSEAPSAAE